MRIWVDADACPSEIKEILFRVAQRRQIHLTLVANQALRTPASPWIETVLVPGGMNVADRKIVELVAEGEGPGLWREWIHDLDFSSLQEVELSQGRTMQIPVAPAAVLAPGQAILELDLLSASVEDVWSERQLEFIPVRDGGLNGFCVWFEAELSRNVILDTGPFSPETHWAQTYMSFSPRPVRAGERVKVSVDFSYDPDPAAIRSYVDLRLGVGEHELSYLID